MTTGGPKKRVKRELAIAALLTAPTIADAAHEVGISEPTLWRWMQDDDFKTEFLTAKKQVLSQSISNLQQAAGAAVATLRTIMGDTAAPAPSRIQAARTILEYSFKGMEHEEIVIRLEAIESALGDDGR